MYTKKFPDDHFGTITKDIIRNLEKGQSIGVFGIPGYGQAFFAEQISHLLTNKYPDIHILKLNLELESNKIAAVEKKILEITKAKNFDEIELIKFLEQKKLIVILSEVNSPKHRKLFKFLNSIRWSNKENFAVLTVANYTLYTQQNDYIDSGKDIFFKIRRIGNFDLRGVKRIIRINNKEYNWEIPESNARKILFLSGGNPALVKAICFAMDEEGKAILDHPEKLINTQPLNFRLTNIARLITQLSIDQQIHLGIINNNGTIFSELLALYTKVNEIEYLDKILPDLTKTDRQILSVFIQNQGKVIDKDQLSLILDQTADTYSEWAIYKAVARVRDKVKDRYTIKTLKGRGWRMES
ncbi:MAG: helix-turn-helix domain-containing protein [Patescibacteria group bacterium]|nr:helix-turn-helix domain-containing protein [Patescibacteria group bacterium]